MNAKLIVALTATLLVTSVHAFKIDTHVWLAQKIQQEAAAGRLDLGEFGMKQAPEQVQESIRRFPNQFLFGVLGADVYPDLIAGQMTTHPGLPVRMQKADVPTTVAEMSLALKMPYDPTARRGWQTDDWLSHVLNAAYHASGSRPTPELAFAYGYLLHAAMDTWAHSYVNLYTGDLFSIVENQEIAARHTLLETYINKRHVSPLGPAAAATAGALPSNAKARSTAGRQLAAKSANDVYTQMHAPTRFVRETLILNPHAADQYARTEGAQHIWAMYALWQTARDTRSRWNQVRGQLNAAVNAATQAVASADAAWRTANTAKNSAVTAAQSAYQAASSAESFAVQKAAELTTAKNNVLNAIKSIPGAQAALDAANGAIEQVLSYLPPPLRNVYTAAATAAQNADKSWQAAVAHYERMAAARDRAVDTLAERAESLDLKQAALTGIRTMRDQAWGAVDSQLTGWRSNIEQGVDGYILAFEETARELMRPKGNRFSPGADPMFPVKVWAACWGPLFGMPALPVPAGGASKQCARTFAGVDAFNSQLMPMIQNAVIPLPLRQQIVAFDEALHDVVVSALPKAGQAFSRMLPGGPAVVPGSLSFMAAMWDHDVTAQNVNGEYASDESQKNLPVYPANGANAVIAMLEADGLPQGSNNSLEAMLEFAPIANALMLSRLTLLDGAALNTLATSRNLTSSLFPDGAPVYPTHPVRGRAGVALIGAIRSIDGNHQWQPIAPPLPRQSTGGRVPEIAEDSTCRRFGYGPAGYGPQRCLNDRYAIAEKSGFRFWYDPALRTGVFNRLFAGPLSVAVCAKLDAKNAAFYQGYGCDGRESFPASADSARLVNVSSAAGSTAKTKSPAPARSASTAKPAQSRTKTPTPARAPVTKPKSTSVRNTGKGG